jgi:hypothetical protein
MDAPNRLIDIKGRDLAGFTLEHARALGGSNRMPLMRYVAIAKTKQMVVCLDTALLEQVAQRVQPEPEFRPFFEALVHVESNSAYWLNYEEPFASGRLHILTREEYERLVASEPEPFIWCSPTG